jgi:hypothetical protein
MAQCKSLPMLCMQTYSLLCMPLVFRYRWHHAIWAVFQSTTTIYAFCTATTFAKRQLEYRTVFHGSKGRKQLCIWWSDGFRWFKIESFHACFYPLAKVVVVFPFLEFFWLHGEIVDSTKPLLRLLACMIYDSEQWKAFHISLVDRHEFWHGDGNSVFVCCRIWSMGIECREVGLTFCMVENMRRIPIHNPLERIRQIAILLVL